MKYVNVKWSNYHALSASGEAFVFKTMEDAEATLESVHDEVVCCAEQKEAQAIADAFNALCESAWTPNQSMDERARNGEIIQGALAILDAALVR